MQISGVIRSIKEVLFGMVAAQAIPILGSLLITRLFMPAEFGTFSAWLGWVLMSAVIVTARFEVALAIEPDGPPRHLAMQATLVTVAIGTVALGAMLFLVYEVVPGVRGWAPALVALYVPAVFLTASLQTWQSWAAAEGQYKKLSMVRIVQAFAITGIQIAMAWAVPNATGLACGQVMGAVVTTLVAVKILPIVSSTKNGLPTRAAIRAFWKKHQRFPRWALPADAINAMCGQLPLLVIASRFGPEMAGFFALTQRVLGAPIGLLSGAVLDVFKRTAATGYRSKGNCKEEYLLILRWLGMIAVVFALSVMLIAETAFPLLFGESWRQAGTIAIWLIPMYALRFVASPLSYVLYIANKQHIDLVWQVALLLMTLLTLHLFMNTEAAVRAYSAGYAALYIVYLAMSWHYSKGKTV